MLSLIKLTTVVRTATAAALISTLVLMLSFAATPAAAAAIVVDGTPNVVGNTVTSCLGTTNPYTTIQSAVSAAPSGATIQVCPGNYPEQVTIATPLTLKGVTDTTDNGGAAVITVPSTFTSGQFTQVDIKASGVTLVNIGVDGTNTVSSCGIAGPVLIGVLFDADSSGTLKQVTLRNHNIPTPSGGYCGDGFPVYATTAASATVADSSFDGIGIDLTTTSSVIVKTTTVAPVYVMVPLGAIPNCVYANAPTGNQLRLLLLPELQRDHGVSMKTSGGAGAIIFQNNSINGTLNAVDLFGSAK